jgi:hypothetical protein
MTWLRRDLYQGAGFSQTTIKFADGRISYVASLVRRVPSTLNLGIAQNPIQLPLSRETRGELAAEY